MHYQEAPHAEAKFVRCTRGAIFDVRRGSAPGLADARAVVRRRAHAPTTEAMLYAPEGFAHGYQTLADDAEMYYMTTARLCRGVGQRRALRRPGVRYRWPLPVSVISEPDRNWPDFQAPDAR